MNSGAPKVLSVPAIHMTSAALLLITNRGRRGRGRNPVSCTNKTNHHVHNITKILLKVAFSTKTLTLITNPVILVSHEWGKDRIVITTNETYQWSCVTQIFRNGQPSHSGDYKTIETMTSTYPLGNPWFWSFRVKSNPLSRKS
jgi:hypothetical protein